MDHYIKYLSYLAAKGGPEKCDYYDLSALILEIAEKIKIGEINNEKKCEVINAFGESFSPVTMQGFAYHKPHGYAGDFQIIDRIYTRYVCQNDHLAKWDLYWQSHDAAEAVRNRVNYFHEVVNNISGSNLKVLNLASGPGRDMLGFFQKHSGNRIEFECVEQDANAIAYAKTLCADFLDKISFHQKNALRFNTKEKYSLIWSAGLFDYFDDSTFVFLLKRLMHFMQPDGEIVIGNFSTLNSSKSYMEIFEWNLHHRSPQSLLAIAEQAGMMVEKVDIRKEESGVNLFLHYKN